MPSTSTDHSSDLPGGTDTAAARGRTGSGCRLLTWPFPSPGGAERALLRHRHRPDQVPLNDLAVVAWAPSSPHPETWQAPVVGDAALSGAFWGFFFTHLFLLPAEEDKLTDGADRALVAFGLPGSYLDGVRRAVTAGTSAIFALSFNQDDASTPGFGTAAPLDVRLDPGRSARLLAAFGAVT